MSARFTVVAGLLGVFALALPAQADPPIPSHNAATLSEPPPRPGPGDADERARRLFDAIVHDDPARAADFFFPRDAFLLVKAIPDPGRYHERLRQHYEADIHALHRSLPPGEKAFERLEIVKRGGWVKVGEEGNRLPYWVSRHSWLHYRVDGKPAKLEVRVMITWDDRWFITHLSEFQPKAP
jgi:hypothetical protein